MSIIAPPRALRSMLARHRPEGSEKMTAIVGLALVAMGTVPWSFLEPAEGSAESAPAPPPHESPFLQGRFTLNALASAEFGDEGDAQYLGRFGGGWFALDGLALNAEVLAGAADPQGEEDAAVVGLDVVLRWHLLRGGEEKEETPWSAFLDIGGGIQQASDEFPPGSHFNFRSRLGFGGTIGIADDVSLIGGASFVHISNSNTGDENPGMSGTLVYVGVHFHF